MTHIPWRYFLHLFALCAIVIAQPIYDWVSRQPEFLVAHGFDALSATFLIATLGVLLPLLIWIVVSSVGLFGKRTSLVAQSMIVGVLGGVLALQWLTAATPWLAFVVAALAAVAVGFAYANVAALHSVLSLLALAGIALPLIFVFTEPVRGMVWPRTFERVMAGDEQSAPEHGVLYVVLDEFPLSALLKSERQIDIARFPNFARLAGQATWYPNASTVSVSTTRALPAFLTGKMPDGNASGLPRWQDYPDNLFTWAAGRYDQSIVSNEPITRLCPDSICSREDVSDVVAMVTLAQDVSVLLGYVVLPAQLAEEWLPPIENRWHNFLDQDWLGLAGFGDYPGGGDTLDHGSADDDLRARFRQSTDQDRDRRWHRFSESVARGFNFLHLLLPHDPYIYLPQGERYRARAQGLEDKEWRVEGLNVLEYQRFLAQVQYTDRLLGDMIDRLQRKGLWDELLVIVASDHGKSFRLGTHKRQISEHSLEDVLRIPLFIKQPGQSRGHVDEYQANITDLAPTIADVTGGSLGWTVDGASLVSDERPIRETMRISCVDSTCSDTLEKVRDGSFVEFEAERIEATDAVGWKHNNIVWSDALNFFTPRTADVALSGRETVSLRIANNQQEGAEVELYDQADFLAVDQRTGHLPALIRGRIRGSASDSIGRVAVALNGKLINTVATVAWRGEENYFAVLAPPEKFIDGRNRISVYHAIERGNGQPMLTRLKGTGVSVSPGDMIMVGGPEGDQASPYLGSGWSGAGKGMRWTDGESAEMYLELADPPAEHLTLRLYGHGFLARGEIESQPVTVKINGREVAVWEVATNRWYEAIIPADVLEDNLLHITFEFQKAAAPCDYGFSEDCRKLAMAVERMELVRAETSASENR